MSRLAFLLAATALAAPAADSQQVDRVGNTGFVQLEAPSFARLSPRQQTLAYWLTQASIAIDPIIYDQCSRFGLAQKRLLEAVVPGGDRKIVDFAKLFWANRGNHNDTTAQKFLPGFTFDELKAAAHAALKRGAFAGTPYGLPAIRTAADLDRELAALRPSLFDPEFEPMITAKSPRGNLDILQASANNFYSNLSLADLKNFKEQHPLNSRLVKSADGRLNEEVYRAGTPDGKIAPGRYALFLQRAIDCLEKAQAVAEPGQDKVLAALARFYQTGDFQDWLQFGIAWVGNNQSVDFANGFIEVYRDARGAKGTSQSFVTITDLNLNDKMVAIAQNGQYFEDRAPWLPQYKKQGVNPPLAKAVETLIETGDFHVTTIGDNLPNENEIRERYGTKSFMFTGSSRALQRANGTSAIDEFAASPADAALLKKYGEEASDLMTSLHEIIGHGSGKLNPRLTAGSESLLKEYYSTLEEARADLMALWNVTDPKLTELKLISSPEVGRAMYLSAAMAPLQQLRRIPHGDTIEEDHQRDRQLIARYIQDKTGAIRQFDRNGKTYIEVTDFKKMRAGVGELLAELMRIKGEGDYEGIKALVDRYGVHFDPKLRDQVVARYNRLNLPTYWAGLNADLTLANGKVSISYPRDYVKQQMRYAAFYRDAPPTRIASGIAGNGAKGFAGDGALAAATQMNNPDGIAQGPDGALYFCDVLNQRIRRIDPATGIVSTVAGSGEKGYSGDGGPAVKAAFNDPYEIAFDRTGNYYIVELNNHTVRRVDGRTGIITTLAGNGTAGFSGDGGPAAKAQLRQPHSLAFDTTGGLLICDVADHRIRRVDLTTGIIETWSGTGERKPTPEGAPHQGTPLNGPRAIAADRDGNLYLVLRDGNAIYRIDAREGRLHRLAGTGEKGYSGDGGPALAARFNGPKGISCAPDGSVYIADTENHVIRRIDANGIINTVAGTGHKGDGPDGDARLCNLARPHGIFVSSGGAIYIGDTDSNRIRMLQ